MSIKIDRIEKEMIREVSNILNSEVKDHNIKFVTITDVKVTSDLSFAKIYFMVLNETKLKETQKALEQASGFIRKQLAERMQLRHTPELTFIYDESIAYGKKIENIIEKIHEEENENQ
jgi:ribosome-binding factor A